jgi:uncharacterized membrane protein YphA (DoxX/SURF4 family)
MAQRVALGMAVITLAIVFVAAAVGKARDRRGTIEAVGELGVPIRFASGVADVLPAVECLAALLLIATPTRPFGATLAAALLVVFTLAMLRQLRNGHRPRCNCFGSLASRPIGADTIVRNVALIALCGVALIG